MFWVALDDTTVQNGCLYFLPGTHKMSHFEVGGSLGQAGIGELFREYPQWSEIEPYAAEMKAGAGVLISELLSLTIGDVWQNRAAVTDLLYDKSIVKGGEIRRAVI